MRDVLIPIAVVVALLVGALVFLRVSGFVLRRVVRRMAERSLRVENESSGVTRWWRAGTARGMLDVVDGGETRRRQRVDSAARMLNHVVALAVWICVTIAVFHLFDIDAAFFISSAGFIGAGLAIGGQHKVNDYLTGLSVLFEDRYGVGDEVVVELVGREPLRAVVEHIGLFSTRLRDETSALHIGNASLVLVRNLSQQAHTETLRLHVGGDPEFDLVSERSTAETVKSMAGQEHLTGLIFVGDLAAERRQDGDIEVEVRTTKPLDDRSRAMLVSRAEDSLRGSL